MERKVIAVVVVVVVVERRVAGGSGGSGQFVTGFPSPLFATETLCRESD